MNTKEAQTYLVQTCKEVITTLAGQHQVEKDNLNIRIDMQHITAKPVFALFEKSAFLAPCSMKELIHAGGGKGFSMLLGMHIRGIIKDLFTAALEQFKLTDTKELFILLYLKANEPLIGIFVNGVFQQSAPIGEIVGEGM